MPKFRPATILAATALGCLLAAGPAAAACAAPGGQHVPRSASWQAVFKVSGSNSPGFTAVTATSSTNAWAFELAGTGAPGAYHFNGSSWTKSSFPDTKGDDVSYASSSSSSNVWAFTFKGKVLRYNGTSWSVVKSFGKVINSGLALSPTDVWVFGQSFAPDIGTWHYNGSTWTKVSSGSGLNGASALSSGNIWAYGGTNVAHWNGSSWKKTSVKSLLPKNTQLSHSFVAGIYAASSSSVYAIASGGRQDEGGPLVLLHYNGSSWSRLALNSSLGGPVAVVPDGHGGLWIPVVIGQGESSMQQWSGGSLHAVTLPYSPAHLSLFAAAAAHGSTAALAVGFTRKSFTSSTTTAVILRYQ